MDQIDQVPAETNDSLGIECPTCVRPLTLLGGRSPMTFSCPAGHVYRIDDLLVAHSVPARRYLLEVIRLWEQKAIVLLRVAQKARSTGHAEVADTFQREVRGLWNRIALIRGSLLTHDSLVPPQPSAPPP